MLKKSAVLGNCYRLDQMRGQVVKANGLSTAVAFGGNGAEHFWLKPYLLFLGVRSVIANGSNTFLVKSDSYGRKGLLPVDRGACTGLDH